MIRGMYEAAASMVTSMTRLVRLGNNLANVTTPGFKQDLSAPVSFKEMMLARMSADGSPSTVGSLAPVVVADKPRLDLTQGMLKETGRPLDLALSGPGFFQVNKDDKVYYTRNGTFEVDNQGVLKTSDGGIVQGENGPITLTPGTVMVDQDGSIEVDGNRVGKLVMVDFPEGTDLRKMGHSYFDPQGAAPIPADQAGVFQGYLEGSNVQVANGMLELLTSRKTCGSSQRVLQLADTALQKAVTDLGRV